MRRCTDGVRPSTLTLAAWRGVFTSPVLMAMVLVTALYGAGQFTIFSYFAPYFKSVIGASTVAVTLLFALFGVFGVIGKHARVALRRPLRRRPRRRRRAVAHGDLAARVALRYIALGHGAGARALGAGLFLVAVDAAGAPERRGAAVRAGH